MNYRFFVPETVRDPGVAIVSGAGIGDFYGWPVPEGELGNVKGETDAARKLRAIGRDTGYLALGYDGPGRGTAAYNPKLADKLGSNFDEVMDDHGAALNKTLVGKGIKRVIVLEHSLGNLMGLAHVQTKAIRNVSHVASTEPTLREYRSVASGTLALAKYRNVEKLYADPEWPAGEEHNVLPISLRRILRDIRLYGPTLRTAKVMGQLVHIGLEQPDIAVTVGLARHGHNGDYTEAASLLNVLNGLRSDMPDAAPYSAHIISGAITHRWFNSSKVMGAVLRDALTASAA